MTVLGKFAPLMRDPDPMAAKRLAQKVFRDTKGQMVVVHKSWLTNWPDRKQLDIIAEKALGVKGSE